SFVVPIENGTTQTLKGGTMPWVCVTISIAETIHEIGDERSWWHCDSTGAGNNNISAVVIPVADGEACLLDEVVVN
ncbi:MAG: hypothetical protein WBA74_06285, partial [Cyclobacteriaceae bacterium]